MVAAMIRAARFLSWLLLALAVSPSAAHRLDEYLQAVLVVIEPTNIQLQINLTPGIEVADQLLARIDQDDDGAISKDEAGAYAELLKRDLSVRLDGHIVGLKSGATSSPRPASYEAVCKSFRWNLSPSATSMPVRTNSSWKTATCLPRAFIFSTQRSPSPAPSK